MGALGVVAFSQSERAIVVAALCAANFICFADRTIMGVCIIPMKQQFEWTENMKGVLLSAFYWGYTVTQLPGGRASEWLGCKPVLVTAVALWSAATWMIPDTASQLPLLLSARVLLGLAEGVHFPCTAMYISQCFTPDMRGRAIAVVFAGIEVGTVTASLLAPRLIVAFGWPSCFRIFGALGVLWCIASRTFLPAPPAVSRGRKQTPIGPMMRHRNFWAVLGAHVCFSAYTHSALNWLPSFFHDPPYSADVGSLGLYTTPPHLCNVLVSVVAGAAADKAVSRGMPALRARRLASAFGFFVPAALLLCFPFAQTRLRGAVLWGMIAGAAAVCVKCGHLLHMMDVAPESVGLLMGVVNTAGSVAGLAANYGAGAMLTAFPGCWQTLFTVLSVILTAGGCCFLFLSSDAPLPREDSELLDSAELKH
eukprot:TRINITY_DN28909_c0_g1_i2.p1 TRINITY_DN28909_c0_g1~~TRINITY_DN28909_c0_g1_i2.p1  ORF type:complete len:423 (+),score=147.02 TRINITY_DN28909_c0_g1_i2:49-1317(+)